MKILMSNLGYLRGISGSLTHHILFAHRHFHCTTAVQNNVWKQLTQIVAKERPDVCCFVEIEQASFHTSNICHLDDLAGESYPYFDIENKYAPTSRLRKLPVTRGKSNAFLAKKEFAFEKYYFMHGTKRLVYKIALTPSVTLFFAHFSLSKKTRAQQLSEVRELIARTEGEVIFMGDFNILGGFKELAPLLQQGNLVLMNQEEHTTFTFHTFQKTLDICLCTKGIAEKCGLRIIPQPYSDHAALLLEVGGL